MISIYALFTLIVICFQIWAAWFLFPYIKSKKAIRYLIGIIGIALVWQLAELASRLYTAPDHALFVMACWHIAYFFIPYLGYLIYRYVTSFINKKINQHTQIVMLCFVTFTAFLGSFTDKLISSIELKYWGFDVVPGDWYSLFIINLFSFFFISIMLLAKSYLKSKDEKVKSSYLLVTVGYSIALLSGCLTDILSPVFGITVLPMGGFGIMIFLLSSIVAMFSFNFLDIRLKEYSIRTKILSAYLLLLGEIVFMAIIASMDGKRQLDQLQDLLSTLEAHPDANNLELTVTTLHSFAHYDPSRYLSYAFITIVILLTVILAIIWTSQMIITPLRELNKSVNRIRKGDLATPLKVSRNDEIGMLTQTFELMRHRLYKLMTSLKQQVSEKTKRLEEKVKAEERTTEAMIYLLEKSKKTARKLTKSERKLKLANIQLRKIDQLKSEFLSNASHELRTPLTSIKMYNQLIYDKALGPINPQQKDALEEILHATNHLIQIVNDILDIKKMEAGKLEYHFELNSLPNVITEALNNLKGLITEKNIVINTQLDNKIPDFRFDKTRIIEVIQNLLSNSIKYNRNNNPITLNVKYIAKPEAKIVIKFIDEGIGMTKESISKLFNKFYQVDASITREIEGTGLGLAITKNIVLAHHGSIKVESSLGKGSTFTVTLPVKQTNN